jgi:hypothetical protein
MRNAFVQKFWIVLALPAMPLAAQWVNYPSPGIPRTKTGAVNLSAPAPKTADGKPDFSGLWHTHDFTTRYLENLAVDGVEVPFQPWSAAVYKERVEDNGKDRPSGRCWPHSVTDFDAHMMPKKVIQTPGLLVMLFESYHSFRQIFTDGRPLPEDPFPTWMGYSIGRWDRDVFVVTTTGLTDRSWLDVVGHPHTDALVMTERFQRIDAGHLDIEVTYTDPGAFRTPLTITQKLRLLPDQDLLEYFCTDNEKDRQRYFTPK